MRKTSLILLGAALGAAMALFATQPRMIFSGASAKAAHTESVSVKQGKWLPRTVDRRIVRVRVQNLGDAAAM